ncbi:hypothetical protein ABZP36_001950 [Zizania latifolia]
MGDAASNQPVLAPSDLGQSNLNASTAAGGGGGGGGGSGFIAIDVGALSSLAGDGPDTAAPVPPRTPKVVRSLSRKGERKPADGDGNGTAGTGERERERPPLSPLFVHVAAADDMSGLRLVHTPVAGTPGGKSRRLGRRPAPWLDPRRVVFLFATLSSVGTLILLYFTLSMSKMDGGGATAAAGDAR